MKEMDAKKMKSVDVVCCRCSAKSYAIEHIPEKLEIPFGKGAFILKGREVCDSCGHTFCEHCDWLENKKKINITDYAAYRRKMRKRKKRERRQR